MSVHASMTKSASALPSAMRVVKFSIRWRCQPGLSDIAQPGSVGRLPRTSTDAGVRWKTNKSAAHSAT